MGVPSDFLALYDLSGGRTGTMRCAIGLDDNQVQEAVNVDYFYSRSGNRRWGSQAFTTGTRAVQTDIDHSLFRYVPNGDEAAAELWCFNADHLTAGAQVERYTTAGWNSPTVKDALLRTVGVYPNAVRCVQFNNKIFLCYKANATVNRLHVWDGSTVRRVGIAAGTAPPTNNSFPAGAITDNRKYKVAWTKQTAGVTTYRSELTPFSVVQTITATAVELERPAAPNEGETHWELYGYSDDDNYGTGYLLSTIAIATLHYIDAAVTMAGDAPPEAGLNEVPTAWRYIMRVGNRLLGAGSFESGGKTSTVWATPPLGASNVGDDERIPNTLFAINIFGFDESDGGEITGFGGTYAGSSIVFKRKRTMRLVPTGQLSSPFQVGDPISSTVGCIRQETVVEACYENGEACVYWLSDQGPYRFGSRGLEYCGTDLEDVWPEARVSLAPAHGEYHADKHQVWWYIGDSIGGGSPHRRIVFDTRRGQSTRQGVIGGWVLHDGASCSAVASVMFSSAPGNPMGQQLIPWVSYSGSKSLLQCDVAGVLTDASNAYAAIIVSKGYPLAGLGNVADGLSPVLLTRGSMGVNGVTVVIGGALIKDYGEDTITDVIDYRGKVTHQYRLGVLPVQAKDAVFVQIMFGDVGDLTGGGSWWWGVEAVAIQRNPTRRA